MKIAYKVAIVAGVVCAVTFCAALELLFMFMHHHELVDGWPDFRALDNLAKGFYASAAACLISFLVAVSAVLAETTRVAKHK